MDYICLKKTLVAVFDHFLSCHDRDDLERMMQAFEAGKSLVIKLPEPIDAQDYAQDIAAMDAAMNAPEPKKVVSRIRRKKPKTAVKKDVTKDMTQIKICDVAVLMDLKKLSKEKRAVLKEVLKGDHNAQIHDFKMSDMHGFAKLRVSKVVEADKAFPVVRSFVPKGTQDDSSFSFNKIVDDSFSSFGGEQIKQNMDNTSDRILRENLIQKIMFEIKKHKDPP